MKAKLFLLMMAITTVQFTVACPVCEKQQPKITRGLTHGAGPQNNWDWVIIGIIAAITLLTFILSLKYLLNPGEKNGNHVKQYILTN
jgi:hypothetical protein